jgi:hypothetical protein
MGHTFNGKRKDGCPESITLESKEGAMPVLMGVAKNALKTRHPCIHGRK